jgi:predicted TIM-barrel fold metal-dependent hydrolase
MQLDDMILISTDDHVVEPANMFEGHVPAKYADDAPKIVRSENGSEAWMFQGRQAGLMGMNAVVSWPKSEWGYEPSSFAEMRPGAYDVHERVRDMNRNGVLSSMCFPTFGGFNGGAFNRAEDKDLSLVMLKSYNDWHIDEWAAAYPGRFIPLAILPIWSPEEMVTEIKRVSAKGCTAASFPELPHMDGRPSYHDLEYWGPVFQALSEEDIPMCMHIGQGLFSITMSPDAPMDNQLILATQVSAIAAQDLLFGPALRAYPDLRLCWSEAGIGWISYFLDRCDRHYTNQEWLGQDFGDQLPSELFRERSLACYVTDPTALKVRHEIGIDGIAWECDYPHSDSIWPNAPEFVLDELNAADVPDDEIDKITWSNACRFFRFDPFTHVAKERASVGALRALATNVDTSIRSRKGWAELFSARAAS